MPKQKKITTIKDLRAAKGLSQAAFAKSIGISTASVGAYEADRIHPSDKVLEKINEVYGVQLPAAKKPVKKAASGKAAKKSAAPKLAMIAGPKKHKGKRYAHPLNLGLNPIPLKFPFVISVPKNGVNIRTIAEI